MTFFFLHSIRLCGDSAFFDDQDDERSHIEMSSQHFVRLYEMELYFPFGSMPKMHVYTVQLEACLVDVVHSLSFFLFG